MNVVLILILNIEYYYNNIKIILFCFLSDYVNIKHKMSYYNEPNSLWISVVQIIPIVPIIQFNKYLLS